MDVGLERGQPALELVLGPLKLLGKCKLLGGVYDGGPRGNYISIWRDAKCELEVKRTAMEHGVFCVLCVLCGGSFEETTVTT